MSAKRLRIAVVGHTNTGKTSLVRTLAHDRDFGEVRDRGGTTRRIVSAELAADSGPRIELVDSPGLENAPELIERLEALGGDRHDGPERIRRLLDDADVCRRFDHEARVLGLVLDIDVALYVIDAREPVLEKFQDELAVLGLCARPIVAVLNFTASEASREGEWREALARVGLHTVLTFDAAVRDPATELRLFEKLRSQLDTHAATLNAWLAHRREEEARRRRAALESIAAMLVDAAGLMREVESGSATELRRAREAMREMVRRREQACVDTLIELYRFGRDDFIDADLPLSEGHWRADPFDPETLRHYGLRTSGYAAMGAGAGAAVDVATGGLSLGAGTLAGAALGAGAGVIGGAGSRLADRLRGREQLRLDDVLLRVLMARSLELLTALVARGHGNPRPIPAVLGRSLEGRLPKTLRRARHHPRWSALNEGGGGLDPHESAMAELVAELDRLAGAHEPDRTAG